MKNLRLDPEQHDREQAALQSTQNAAAAPVTAEAATPSSANMPGEVTAASSAAVPQINSPQGGSVQSGSVQSGSVQSGSVQSGSVQSGSIQSGSVDPVMLDIISEQGGEQVNSSVTESAPAPDAHPWINLSGSGHDLNQLIEWAAQGHPTVPLRTQAHKTATPERLHELSELWQSLLPQQEAGPLRVVAPIAWARVERNGARHAGQIEDSWITQTRLDPEVALTLEDALREASPALRWRLNELKDRLTPGPEALLDAALRDISTLLGPGSLDSVSPRHWKLPGLGLHWQLGPWLNIATPTAAHWRTIHLGLSSLMLQLCSAGGEAATALMAPATGDPLISRAQDLKQWTAALAIACARLEVRLMVNLKVQRELRASVHSQYAAYRLNAGKTGESEQDPPSEAEFTQEALNILRRRISLGEDLHDWIQPQRSWNSARGQEALARAWRDAHPNPKRLRRVRATAQVQQSRWDSAQRDLDLWDRHQNSLTPQARQDWIRLQCQSWEEQWIPAGR